MAIFHMSKEIYLGCIKAINRRRGYFPNNPLYFLCFIYKYVGGSLKVTLSLNGSWIFPAAHICLYSAIWQCGRCLCKHRITPPLGKCSWDDLRSIHQNESRHPQKPRTILCFFIISLLLAYYQLTYKKNGWWGGRGGPVDHPWFFT